jgi:putative peptidoglycan lipid II flippase
MVPVLARSAKRAAVDPKAKAHVEQTSSALLTWSIVILLPVTVVIAAVAGPISQALNPVNPNADCSHADMISATSFMLVTFAPQILLYGVSVVLFGLLQAYRRFGARACAGDRQRDDHVLPGLRAIDHNSSGEYAAHSAALLSTAPR